MSDYKLVPVEPTPEMRRKAGLSRGADYYTITKVWRAMLDAAPQPPQGAQVMSDPVIRRVRRSIDEAKNRGGMRVGMPKVTIDASDANRLCIMAEARAAAPAVQGEPLGYVVPRMAAHLGKGELCGISVLDQPEDGHTLPVYLAPQPAEQQSCPEDIREGAPYDDSDFESLCREHEIWGTVAAAQCAVFWEAGKRVAVQKPAPDAAGLVEALVAILEHDSPINIVDTATATERDIFDIARAALAAHRKQGGEG